MDDPNSSFADFESIISTDSNLAARLLKMANSSFYGLETKIETITQALGVVGTKPMVEMALTSVMFDKMKSIESNIRGIRGFWKHNVACGLAARIIGQTMGRDDLETLYTAGMLHDMGTLVINYENPKKALQILTRCKSEGIPQCQAEEEELGFSHARLGALIFKEWRFSPVLVECVDYHHEPSKGINYPLETAIVHVADYLVHSMHMDYEDGFPLPPLDPKVTGFSSVSRQSLGYIRQAVNAQMAEVFDFFALESLAA